MLTTDLVGVVRRSGRLHVPELRRERKDRLESVAGELSAVAAAHVGRTRGELARAMDAVAHEPSDHREVRGLAKLVTDRCRFDEDGATGEAARDLRKRVFERAAAARRSTGSLGRFDREAVLAAVAREIGAGVEKVEAGLFADLRHNHVLAAFDAIDGPGLMRAYEMARRQAVLLRAVKVTVILTGADTASLRALFGRLKFLRLLYLIERLDGGGIRIVLDGPMSVLRTVTKYGLSLAMVLPVLERTGRWELDAEVLWDRDMPAYAFHLEGGAAKQGAADGEALDARLPDEVARLMEAFARLDTPWKARAASDVLDLPGVGVCVPDLAFTHAETGELVYLEVMGYWSRETVWKRVDMVQAGLPWRVIFAVSERLRVSEKVLDASLPGRLYVYKGVMHAPAILAML